MRKKSTDNLEEEINEYKKKTQEYSTMVCNELIQRENKANVSAREIQRHSGVSHGTYDRIINSSEISFNSLLRLIYYYGMTPAEFFCVVEGKEIADDALVSKVKAAKALLDEVV